MRNKQSYKMIIAIVVIVLGVCLLLQVQSKDLSQNEKVMVMQGEEYIDLYEHLLFEEAMIDGKWEQNSNDNAEVLSKEISNDVPVIYWNKESQIYIPDSLELDYIKVFDGMQVRESRRKPTEQFTTVQQFYEFLAETERKTFFVSVAVMKKGAFILPALKYETVRNEYVFYMDHQGKFVSNGKNEPYEQGIPLHEMDFSVYRKYDNNAYALALVINKNPCVELPFDLNYYTYKNDLEPAFTLNKGTKIYVFGTRINHFESSSTLSYGLQTWPDYEAEWRYGTPFFTEDFLAKDLKVSLPMYYVKTSDLEEIAKLYYYEREPENGTFSRFKYFYIGHWDRILYDRGAFDSGY